MYHNQYIALRHGHSEANEAGLIVSNPASGCARFGLSNRGKREIRRRVENSRLIASATRILSSDFLRALETAQQVRDRYPVLPLETDARLRERFFGDFEMQLNRHYDSVWARDRLDPDSTDHGVESARQVLDRTTRLIGDCESRYRNEVVLLVSHGDPLQILECAFLGWNPSRHRDLPALETGEVRDFGS